ncbi:hypothetical protein [Brenneria corticis]|nr:hypothetical protein [Brenneria sp. CFCC 11842]
MARDLIIALDEGTSNVKAVAIDALGQAAAKASCRSCRRWGSCPTNG